MGTRTITRVYATLVGLVLLTAISSSVATAVPQSAYVVAAALLSADEESSGSESETPAPAEIEGDDAPKWYRGSLDVGLDATASDEDTDVKLDQYLRLELKPPEYERLRIRSGLWIIEDLDGDEKGSSTLRTINDSFGTAIQARLYYLYVEAKDLWGNSTLRIGRQRVVDSPANNRLDGAYFKQRLGRWDWYLFGGARASVYSDGHEDLVLGGGAAYRPGPWTRLTLDTFYGEDDRRTSEEVFRLPFLDYLSLPFPRRVRRQIESRQVAVSFRQQLTDNHTLYGRYTWHDGSSDELLLSATGYFPKSNIVYDVSYRTRLQILSDRTNDTTGFYRILGKQNEFQDGLATVHIPLSQRYTLSLEAQIHDSDDDDRNSGNRDYQRYASILSATELLPGLDASAAVERWDVKDGAGTWAVTGELTKRWERTTFGLGADFERYEDRVEKYRPEFLLASQLVTALTPGLYPRRSLLAALLDVETVETHENIYSFYASVLYRMRDNQQIRFKTTYEQDDGPDSPYWRIQATYTLEF